jgi:hypothetical protein
MDWTIGFKTPRKIVSLQTSMGIHISIKNSNICDLYTLKKKYDLTRVIGVDTLIMCDM